ncbi:IS66 family insertion sequence element accessory protein TnpB [Halomonas sp. ISL-60]|uniref:IS66 family insertion sequence element accessory protein TnpB n=1 Tax=Halomonas sp. ISL-56 TaxID=2819149 RepID=UPI001BE98F2B|nr:IS66 family insertion sequence element accessory protein TnpB [Halomonas sp. ISL-56]MBT2772753.1 IS66 family insertion sequence element accessory protein TnpB [Halomonas sp. ISL-60]MBT2800548.1 IS66 family insertion sequence element accessory protein TnpB [Halomonas sp. ISL-56]
MIRPSTDLKVYLCREPVEIDGLALLVQEAMALNPFDKALFVFGNRQRYKVKLLFWERNGFVVWYKCLERERFKWPTHLEGNTVTLTGQELNWLLDGVNLKAMQPHNALDFQQVG